MSIDDFGQRNEAMSTLGRRELKEAIAREKARSGGERLLQPSATPARPMPLPSMPRPRSRCGQPETTRGQAFTLIGVVIGFVYVFSAKLTSVSAIRVGVPPVVAAWTPNVLFGLLGIVHRVAPK